MKKLFLIPLTLILTFISVLATGCDDGWTQVQSITYQTDSGNVTRNSVLVLCTRETPITEEEYYDKRGNQNIPDIIIDKGCKIPTNRNELTKIIAEAKSYVGKTYYRMDGDPNSQMFYYYEQYITNYKLHYVSIKTANSGYIEIKSYDYQEDKYIIKKILPLSYEITYFND